MPNNFDVIASNGMAVASYPGLFSPYRVVADVTEDFGSSVKLLASTCVFANESVNKIIQENCKSIRNPNRWKVAQTGSIPNRVAVQKFRSVPYSILETHWRKPLHLLNSGLVPRSNGIFTFTNTNYFQNTPKAVSIYLDWAEVSSAKKGMLGMHDDPSKKVMEFMRRFSPEVYLFSDRESIFPDPQIEFAYISDFMNRY